MCAFDAIAIAMKLAIVVVFDILAMLIMVILSFMVVAEIIIAGMIVPRNRTLQLLFRTIMSQHGLSQLRKRRDARVCSSLQLCTRISAHASPSCKCVLAAAAVAVSIVFHT